MPPLPSIFPPWLDTPNTPDLGCFVQRKHEFQLNANFHLWAEIAPWNNSGYLPNQAYFRVKCGKARFHQRVKVWMRRGFDPIVLSGLNPDAMLGGDFRPYPSEWVKFPPQRGEMTYWFSGEHRDPSAGDWRRDAAVGHTFDLYDRGTLSTVGWDDAGGDRDFDDMVVEVALVRRQDYFGELHPIEIERDAGYDRFIREEFPKYLEEKAPPSDSAGR